MIDREHALPVSRQVRLVGIARSSVWRDNLDERRATIRMRMSRRG
jgi:hypothetical protein